jgi:AraC-like DNA-binding protein
MSGRVIGISAGQLAAAAGLSKARFSHLFYFQTGMLPRDFLRMLRQLREEQKLAAEILDGISCAEASRKIHRGISKLKTHTTLPPNPR